MSTPDTLSARLRDDAREMVRLNRGINHCSENEKHTLPWKAANEIDRLTALVEQSQTHAENVGQTYAELAVKHKHLRDKADALAEAAEKFKKEMDTDGWVPDGAVKILFSVLTAYREQK